jgi:hypothetical protein
MDIAPTGCSTWKELFSSKVGLSKADRSGRGSIELDIVAVISLAEGPIGPMEETRGHSAMNDSASHGLQLVACCKSV